MTVGVSGCPKRVEAVGAQHLAGGALAEKPVTIRSASGIEAMPEIVEPAAGPVESRHQGGGAQIHRRSSTRVAGDDAGREGSAACPPRERDLSPCAGVYLWRGKTYLGLRAVAEASGCNMRTVQYHLARHGHLDHLGVGPGKGPDNRGYRGGKPVTVCGRTWPSRAAFARDLGVSWKTAWLYLKGGKLDRIMVRLMAAEAERGARTRKGAQR